MSFRLGRIAFKSTKAMEGIPDCAREGTLHKSKAIWSKTPADNIVDKIGLRFMDTILSSLAIAS